MTRVARAHVRTQASADEVVQETLLAVLRGLGGFEGRSSLKTWVYRILLNIARTQGVVESRTLPFSSADPGDDVAGRAVGGDRPTNSSETSAHRVVFASRNRTSRVGRTRSRARCSGSVPRQPAELG